MKAGIYKTPNGNLIYVAKDRTIKAATEAPGFVVASGAKVSHRSKDDTVLIERTDYRCTRFADVPNGCNDFDRALADALVKWRLDNKAIIQQEIVDTLREHCKRIDPRRVTVIKPENVDHALPTFTNPRPIEEQAAELEAIAADIEASDPEGAAEFRAGAEAVRNGGGFVIGVDLSDKPAEAFMHLGQSTVRAAEAFEEFSKAMFYGLERETEERTKLREKGYSFCHNRSARKHRRQGHEVFYVPVLRQFAWRAVPS